MFGKWCSVFGADTLQLVAAQPEAVLGSKGMSTGLQSHSSVMALEREACAASCLYCDKSAGKSNVLLTVPHVSLVVILFVLCYDCSKILENKPKMTHFVLFIHQKSYQSQILNAVNALFWFYSLILSRDN